MELKEFQEKWHQRREQQEEELQQLREIYHNKQHKTFTEKQQKLFIHSLSKKMKMFQEQWDQRIKQE